MPLQVTINFEIISVSSFSKTSIPHLGLEALDFLALNHNLLTTLSASHFEGLPRLSSLELDYNKIAKIDSAAFKGLESKIKKS